MVTRICESVSAATNGIIDQLQCFAEYAQHYVADNQALKMRVHSLAQQVSGLESQLSRLMKLLTR